MKKQQIATTGGTPRRKPIGPVLVLAIALASCSRSSASQPQSSQPADSAVAQTSMQGLAPPAGEGLFVDIREFQVPTEGALPHDPAVGPDGMLWVTEEKANKLARFDLTTESFREYALKTPDSGPHGLTVDSAGDVWFTANAKGYIGKLHPASGAVTEYRMPDPRVTDPHTPVLAHDTVLWFTAEESNFVGKLDTKTGHIRLKELPTSRALPYGAVIGKDGALYVCEFGTNKIARIEPSSMAIREYPLPDGARPRRVALAPDGTLYYSDYARGKLGHFLPGTARSEEWQSPGGPNAKPYGIAVTPDGRVWYSESGVQPNTLVRFDPESRQFAQAPIPSGERTSPNDAIVRNMAATPDGRIYLACSGTNRVAVAVPRDRPPAWSQTSPRSTDEQAQPSDSAHKLPSFPPELPPRPVPR
jgi:virginiamycin B lyase